MKQDTQQRLLLVPAIIIELYRVITSSLLIVFVPQKCETHVCSLTENLQLTDSFYNFSLVFNFISLFSLALMYTFEIWRENSLIKYLEVNPKLPNEEENVATTLGIMDSKKMKRIHTVDKRHQVTSYIAMITYALNVIFSSIVINKYYLSGQTISTFITYALFMSLKFASVYSIVNTTKNVFYSSYIKAFVQFNDIQPKKINIII